MTAELRSVARSLLERGDVEVVIGYRAGSHGDGARPAFVTSPDEVECLVWNRACSGNLVVHLTRSEVRELGRPAVTAKGCDVRSLTVLLQENRIRREDVVVIGLTCDGVVHGGEVPPGCAGCQVHTPPLYDHLIGTEPTPEQEATASEELERIEAMTPQERWSFWQSELERCIKCYACRAACPLCHCERCFVDVTRPAWTSCSQSARANFAFHLFRAFHLTGRCVGCGACERACPEDIPLGLLNRKMALEVSDLYDQVAGMDPDEKPALLTFDPDDREDFIR